MYEDETNAFALTKEERDTAMFIHLAGLCYFLAIPFAGLIAPLILWLMKRDESSYIDTHGREVVNFQITVGIYVFLGIILIFFVIGIFMLIGLSLMVLICSIMGAIKAKDGETYRYPLTFRFL